MLSFFLRFVDPPENDFLLLDKIAVSFLINFGKVFGKVIGRSGLIISFEFGSLNGSVFFFFPKLSHEHFGSFNVRQGVGYKVLFFRILSGVVLVDGLGNGHEGVGVEKFGEGFFDFFIDLVVDLIGGLGDLCLDELDGGVLRFFEGDGGEFVIKLFEDGLGLDEGRLFIGLLFL